MFLQDERGAVTVDWVVLTAGLVGLGFAVAGAVSIRVQDTSGDIKDELMKDGIVQTSLYADEWETINAYQMENCQGGKEALVEWFEAMHEVGEWDGSSPRGYDLSAGRGEIMFDFLYENNESGHGPWLTDFYEDNGAGVGHDEFDYDGWYFEVGVMECLAVDYGYK